jgi:hypothetical protein
MRRKTWVFIFILLTGFALRLALHDFHGLEGDDGVSLALSRYDLNTLIPGLMTLQLDVHPPLYYLTLKGWIAVAGDSLLALRLLNIFLDMLTGALMMLLGRRSFGVRVAPTVIAGILWAVAPMLVFIGYLVRMYAMVTLFVTAGAVCTVSARGQRAHLWYLGAAACGLAAMYAHSIGVAALTAFGGVIALNGLLRRVPRRATLIGLAGIFVAGILYLPFAIHLFARFQSGRPMFTPRGFNSPLEVPGRVVNTWLTHRALDSTLADTLVLFLLVIGSILVWRRTRALSLLTLFWAALVGTTLLVWFADLYLPRYLAPFAPLMLVMIAGIVGTFPCRTWRGGTQWAIKEVIEVSGQFALPCVTQRGVVVLLLVALGIHGITADLDHIVHDDWMAAADFIETHDQPGDLVLLIPDWGQDAFRYHYRGQAEIVGAMPGVSQDLNLDGILGSEVEGNPRVWYINYQPEVSDPDELADSWFRAQAITVTEVFPTGMDIKLYDFAPDESTLPEIARPLDAQFGDVAALHGVYLPLTQGSAHDTRLHPPSNWVQVILYWETLQPGADFVPRVRLTDTFGQVYAGALERDNDLLHRMPVSTWRADTLYRTAYDLNINPDTPPGTYNIEVMVLVGGEPLPATGADTGERWVIAGQFVIEG